MDRRLMILPMIIPVFTLIVMSEAACDLGWFGSKCQYKCHCVNNKCDSTGQCLHNSKCQTGWFGLGCQYQDLTTIFTATITTSPNQTSLSWLTDNNDTTCNTDKSLESITLTWNTSYVFTWLQISVKDTASLKYFNLMLQRFSSSADCNGKEILNLYNSTFEIHCKVQVVLTQLTMIGGDVKRICSLFINGGRNVALRQMTSQSSDYTGEPEINKNASNAVDGDPNSDFTQNSCSHTQPGAPPYPTWTVIFSHQYIITRFILYNKEGFYGLRLIHFNLRAFNANNLTVFDYTDESSDNKLTFQVLDVSGENPVQGATVTAYNKVYQDVTPILTLCEMESYGDCPQGTWGLECENCPVSCYNTSCQRDSGLCVKGCHGYSNPPLCTLSCKPGTWGYNCGQPCNSPNCHNSCNRDTGICDLGCDGYSDSPTCSVVHLECDEGFYGQNCSKVCSTNCKDGLCNSLSGICFSCKPGYGGDFCTQVISFPNDDVTPLVTIIGPIFATVVVIVLVVAAVIFWRRLRRVEPVQMAELTGDIDIPSNGHVTRSSKTTPSLDTLCHDEIHKLKNPSVVHDLHLLKRSLAGEVVKSQFKSQHTDRYDVLERFPDSFQYVNTTTLAQSSITASYEPQETEPHVYETFDPTFNTSIKENIK